MPEDVELFLIGDKAKKLNMALKAANRTNAELEEDIKILNTWMKSQLHFPETPNHAFMTNLVILNKFSIEKCKQHLDMYYSLRSVIPELFKNKHFSEPHMKVAANVINYVALPKLTEEGYRVSVVSLTNTNSNDFDVYNVVAYLQNFIEIRMVADVMMGEILIADMKNYSFSHITKITPVHVKKCFTSAEKVYKNLIKQIHYINVAPYVENLISLVKQVVSKKLAERIYAHQTADKLSAFMSKDILPKEYGGPDYTLKDLKGKWEALAVKYDQRLRELENIKTDESKRPTPLVNDETLGFYGNFKKLNVD